MRGRVCRGMGHWLHLATSKARGADPTHTQLAWEHVEANSQGTSQQAGRASGHQTGRNGHIFTPQLLIKDSLYNSLHKNKMISNLFEPA